MPEVVTKHPDVVKEVLQSAGAKCGVGAPQQILNKCPREHFCALPGGEICVYSVDGVSDMTQLTRAELCQARSDAPPVPPGTSAAAVAGLGASAVLPLLAVAAIARRRRRR
jgi:hypothetical protein